MTFAGVVLFLVCMLMAATGSIMVYAGVVQHDCVASIVGGLFFGTGVGFGTSVLLDD